MKGERANFLVTLVFDEDSGIKEQVDTEYSFKNKIIKELQGLIKDKVIKHFIVADDEVINDKLKEHQEPVLDKVRAEIIKAKSKKNIGVWDCIDIIDKYRAENKE